MRPPRASRSTSCNIAQAKAVAAALNDLFGGGGGGGQGDSDKDQLEPSGFGSVTSNAPPTGSTRASAPGGAGGAGGGGGAAGADAANGGAGSPFGVLKAAMASGGGAARASTADTDALRGSGGGSGAKVRVTADPSSNSLLINASPADYKLVERAIHQMDRQPVQVDIEATIAEVTLTDQLQYGVQFFLQGNRTLGLSGAQNLQVSNLNTAGLNLLAGGLSSPRVLVSALQGYTNVKILSSPSLVVLDRQPAVLQVGNQVPILTRTAQSTENALSPVVNNVDYKDTGIILNVLPKVNANGVVTLDIEQQISAVVSTDPHHADADHLAAPRPLLGGGLERPDRDAGGPHQRLAVERPVRHPRPRLDHLPQRPADQPRLGGEPHRDHHLHQAADHLQRRRCRAGHRGVPRPAPVDAAHAGAADRAPRLTGPARCPIPATRRRRHGPQGPRPQDMRPQDLRRPCWRSGWRCRPASSWHWPR